MWTTRWDTRSRRPSSTRSATTWSATARGAFPFQDLDDDRPSGDWIVAFCRAILDRGLDIRWQLPSGTRCEVVDDEVRAPLGIRLPLLRLCPGKRFRRDAAADQKRMKRSRCSRRSTRRQARHQPHLASSCSASRTTATRPAPDLAFVRELARAEWDDVACGFSFPSRRPSLYDQLFSPSGRIRHGRRIAAGADPLHDATDGPSRNYLEASRLALTLYRLPRAGSTSIRSRFCASASNRPHRAQRLQGREESKLDSFVPQLSGHWARAFRRLAARMGAERRQPIARA